MTATPHTAAPETPAQSKKRLRKVAAATIFGSMLEWYDFYLYATMAAIVFSKIFFDNSDPKTASLMAFSTFAIGFIARPFGGILFGYLGDKFGRKQVLVLTFCMMGVCTTLIGLIPSYASIGIWAPIILVFIRIIQGLGAGAELSGAAVTSYEHASEGKRGSQGAWPALGLNLGLLLSSLTVYLLTINGNDFMLAGGWRIPFICSIALVGVGLWVRNSIPETPEFKELSQAPKVAKPSPLKALFKNDLKGLAVVFFVAIGYNALSYIFKTFSLAYLTQFKGVDVHVTSLSVTDCQPDRHRRGAVLRLAVRQMEQQKSAGTRRRLLAVVCLPVPGPARHWRQPDDLHCHRRRHRPARSHDVRAPGLVLKPAIPDPDALLGLRHRPRNRYRYRRRPGTAGSLVPGGRVTDPRHRRGGDYPRDCGTAGGGVRLVRPGP